MLDEAFLCAKKQLSVAAAKVRHRDNVYNIPAEQGIEHCALLRAPEAAQDSPKTLIRRGYVSTATDGPNEL